MAEARTERLVEARLLRGKIAGRSAQTLLLVGTLALQMACTKPPADPPGVGEQPDTSKGQEGMPAKPGTVPPAPPAANEPSATVDDRDSLGTTLPATPSDRRGIVRKPGNAAARACDPAKNADCDKPAPTADAK
jgi:hypothetical protein